MRLVGIQDNQELDARGVQPCKFRRRIFLQVSECNLPYFFRCFAESVYVFLWRLKTRLILAMKIMFMRHTEDLIGRDTQMF